MSKAATALILILCIAVPAAPQDRPRPPLPVAPRGMKAASDLFGGVYSATAITLDRGVHETTTPTFDLPVAMPQEYRDMLESIRLLVSEDQGKTWRLDQEMSPDRTRFSIKAPRDGLYWYVLQVKQKDGKMLPAQPGDERPHQRVYVNTARRPTLGRSIVAAYGGELPNHASMEEVERLRSEVRDLRTLVEGLQKRLERLEKQADN